MHALIISLSLLSGAANSGVEEMEPNVIKMSAETQAVLERVDSAGAWVSTALDTLADKLGTTVEYLWPTFVKEVVITGVMNVVGGLIALALSITLFIFLLWIRDSLIKEYNCRNDRDSWPDGAVFAQVFAIIFLIMGFVIFVCLLVPGVISIVAPEPEALYNITKAISNLK